MGFTAVVNDQFSLKARAFAVKAHGDQMYGSRPYVVHLDEVYELSKDYEPRPFTGLTAYLHDVLEDTSVTFRTLADNFGGGVASCVELLTDGEGETRKEKKKKVYERLSQLGSVGPNDYLSAALIVKACDRLANVRNCFADNPGKLEMYRKEHSEFRQAIYRPGLCDPIWSELDEKLED